MTKLIDSVTRPRVTHFLFLIVSVLCASTWTTTQSHLLKGFKATPSRIVSSFQALLNDSTGNFSLGFLRVDQAKLALVVLHVPSDEPFWVANPTRLARWSGNTHLFFNGSLVISDSQSGLFWSTGTLGDRVVLLNNSNLQILRLEGSQSVVWQSFDFPSNTLVENQNFTSTMSLVSSNGLYSMRLGNNFMGLYAAFAQNSHQIYWKRTALQAKAEIVEGKGPILARINSDGYLGMYQTGNPLPVDVQSFSSFQRPVNGLLRIRIEPDGNLKGYYWDGSKWLLNYQAITESCELPSPCGSYGMCRSGDGCSCLDNRTEFSSGTCFAPQSGDFCNERGAKVNFRVLRRNGVELANEELIPFQTTSSLEQCENLCAENCSCWGAVYNNGSGFCYLVDYPIPTLVGLVDESKIGYFKVRSGAGKKMDVGLGVGLAILSGAIVVLVGVIGFGSYRIWKKKVGNRILEEDDGVSPGPYKNLGSASFRSIEMCNR